MISYIVSYCNRFVILFTQIRHEKQANTKSKESVFNFIVWYLEKYSSTCYITTAFTLASGHPGLETRILYYYTL